MDLFYYKMFKLLIIYFISRIFSVSEGSGLVIVKRMGFEFR